LSYDHAPDDVNKYYSDRYLKESKLDE
jgi:hypothetical protein